MEPYFTKWPSPMEMLTLRLATSNFKHVQVSKGKVKIGVNVMVERKENVFIRGH